MCLGVFDQEMARTKQTTRKSTGGPQATKVWVEESEDAEDGGGKRAKVEKVEKVATPQTPEEQDDSTRTETPDDYEDKD